MLSCVLNEMQSTGDVSKFVFPPPFESRPRCFLKSQECARLALSVYELKVSTNKGEKYSSRSCWIRKRPVDDISIFFLEISADLIRFESEANRANVRTSSGDES